MDSTADIITTAADRSATAPVALSLPMTVRQEATARVITADITPRPTAAAAALATDRAARVPPLPNRVRSATAVEVEAALEVTSRQALGRPYRIVRSRPTHLPHPEALHQAVPTAHRREVIVHRRGATLHQAGRIVRHQEAIVHLTGAIQYPVGLIAHHQEAIVRRQGQVAIRREHKVAAEVLEAAGDLTEGRD